MPISGYFDLPFGVNGTLTAVPDPTQGSGAVSYNQGWTVAYSTPVGSGGFNIPRGSMNQILYDITSAIQTIQQGSPPAFITSTMNGGSPYSYPAGAYVSLAGTNYISLVGSNTDTPPTANWRTVSAAGYVLPDATNSVLGGVIVDNTSISATAGVISTIPATKSIMQAATNTTETVTPAQMQNHPGVAKAWCVFTGSTGAILDSYNIASITRNTTGDYTVAFTNNFSSANYCIIASAGGGSSTSACANVKNGTTPTSSGFEFVVQNNTGTPSNVDEVYVYFQVFGNQ